ncbi:hypothetical protein BCR44DRAFT_43583 [Catenaria anguillulae PL171]|uniref:Uncharacterized protein n=1 Tax=Catenaria anguillulae PL171 TaxID=765915 RepID=A0A1Y2HMN9_9FUNG|nr:hypothetical protein BCR44DRAFT_43583 [Catenaria anguillulae PL171]
MRGSDPIHSIRHPIHTIRRTSTADPTPESTANPTPQQIDRYDALVPYISTILSSTAQRDPHLWVFHDSHDTLKLEYIAQPRRAERGNNRQGRGGHERMHLAHGKMEILYVLQTSMHHFHGLFEVNGESSDLDDEYEEEEEQDRYYEDDFDEDERYYREEQEERNRNMDLTACDKECGYCGQCPY